MNWKLKAAMGAALGAATLAMATSSMAQITFYEHEGFRGRPLSANRSVPNFIREGYNDRASSAIVERGPWEVCDDANFHGRCIVLRPGNYSSLAQFGLNDRVSSVRPANPRGNYDGYYQPEPAPAPVYEYRRRPSERLREVPVTSVRAVMGPPERRCWVDREQVSDRGDNNNVGGAIIGGIIGGILGHQVGGGRGKDAATAVGAVAGAAIGSNAGSSGNSSYGRDVERCRNVESGRPAYWDVTYEFRGRENRVQMSTPPGRTILINGNGEPRQ
jgi:uncharacterized protein YcfJ